jgi:hypothetical protein
LQRINSRRSSSERQFSRPTAIRLRPSSRLHGSHNSRFGKHLSTTLPVLLRAHPAPLPRIRFLFVRPALCFQLPPDSPHLRNRCLPLTVPRVGSVVDFHHQVRAPCRAHKKRPRESRGPDLRPIERSARNARSGHRTESLHATCSVRSPHSSCH